MSPDRKYLLGGLLLLLGIPLLVIIFQMHNRPDTGPGSTLYREHCSACHGQDGKGLRALYPPLADSPYLIEQQALLPCLIRVGIRGSLVTADGSYNQRMPAFPDLTPAALSQLILYLQSRWGKTSQDSSVKNVEQQLLLCP